MALIYNAVNTFRITWSDTSGVVCY